MSSVSFLASRHRTCIKQAGQRHEAIIRSIILGSNLCVHASGLRDHEVLIHKILHLTPEPGYVQILDHSGILDLIHV
jgi:hypothetical protein